MPQSIQSWESVARFESRIAMRRTLAPSRSVFWPASGRSGAQILAGCCNRRGISRSVGRRRHRADDLRDRVADVPESVRGLAVEIVPVTFLENPRLAADGHLD